MDPRYYGFCYVEYRILLNFLKGSLILFCQVIQQFTLALLDPLKVWLQVFKEASIEVSILGII